MESLPSLVLSYQYSVFKVQPIPLFLLCCSGSHLLSHAVSNVVPSAAYGLTIVFGMGTGISHRRIATGTSLIYSQADEQQYNPYFFPLERR